MVVFILVLRLQGWVSGCIANYYGFETIKMVTTAKKYNVLR
jgi:hypothetical protein